MSQYVARATGMATKALDVAKTRVLPPAVEWYNATMAKNAQYVVKDPEAVDKLGKQLIYSNMAKLPAAVEAAQGEIKVVQQKWANRMELPMTEVRSRRPFAHRIRRARPASSFPRERCWQHRGTPENRTHDSPIPSLLTAGWHRRSLLRGGVRVVLRRGNHRPRREPDRLLSAPPDRANARKYLSDRALPRDDARALPVCREGA
jgi:F-type H+-transporting ATPase subunit g